MGTILFILAVLFMLYCALVVLYTPLLLLQFYAPHLLVKSSPGISTMADLRKQVVTSGLMRQGLFFFRALFGYPLETLGRFYQGKALAFNLSYSKRFSGHTLNHGK